MKNKGRKHKSTSANCKGELTFISRPIESMGKSNKDNPNYSMKWLQKCWQKRLRGYLKTEKGKEIFGLTEN